VVDWLRGHWGGRPHIFTDCRENLPPVPEWNTDFPKVLICEMAENGNVNLVLGKALSVLPETEPFEPVRNLLHRRPSTDLTLSVLDRHVVRVLPTLAKIEYLGRPRRRAHTEQGIVADLCTLEVAGLGSGR
jgi:hypothetical protein